MGGIATSAKSPNDPDYEPEHNCWSCFQKRDIENHKDIVYCDCPKFEGVIIYPDETCERWDG